MTNTPEPLAADKPALARRPVRSHENYYTESDVMDMFDITEQALDNMRYRRDIEWFKVGRQVRFTKEAIDDFVERNTKKRGRQCEADSSLSSERTLRSITSSGVKVAGHDVSQRGAAIARMLKNSFQPS